MAIYHFSAKVISRANGSSVVASAAYRAAERLADERLGRDHDFSNKAGVVHSEVILPEGAPERLSDRATLWNAVEAGEKRKDAQLAREVEFSIPREMNQEQGVALARDFAKDKFVDRGMIADLNVHWDYAEDGTPKPHAHVMLSMREVGPDGFGPKVRDWNRNELLQEWREAWADHVNERLSALDIDARIDHRTLEAQGINLEPQHKIGPAGMRRLDRGEDAERADDHVRIARENGTRIIAEPAIALEAITRMQATFTTRDLAMFAHRHSDGKDQFDQVMGAVRASPELVALGQDGKSQERFTSREMIAVEQRLERTGDSLAGTDRHFVAAPHVYRALEAAEGRGLSLSTEQRDALGRITARDGLASVVGYAGTGKSAMLGVAREAWEDAGYTVRGAALSGIAAENLEGGSGIASRTIASLEYQWAQGREQLGSRDVLVIDEAGMIGTRQMERVLSAADQAGAKVVLVGDPEQLQAIEAGAAFRSIAERHGAVEITSIRRQREEWQRDATRALATGRTAEAVHSYERNGMVQVADTREHARAELVDKWDAQRVADRDQTRIILTHTNAEVRDLNLAARDRLREGGELGEDVRVSAERGGRDFAAGDRLMFLKNERGLGVKNGSLGTVERVSSTDMAVRLDDGRSVAFDLKDYAHIDHGYAATIHKSQGVTVDRAHVLATPGMDRHSAYVALSRHRDGVQLHYGRDDFDDQRSLIRTLSRDRAKDMASDYARDPSEGIRAFADRRGLGGETESPKARVRSPDPGAEIQTPGQGASGQEPEGDAPRKPGMFDGFRPGVRKAQIENNQPAPKRGIFDGLKLRASPTPEVAQQPARRGPEQGFADAVERLSRPAVAIMDARAKGMPVLEHQRVALEKAQGALDQIRPDGSRDFTAVLDRDPWKIRDAAQGSPTALIDGMAYEARLRSDPGLRADRFVESWRGVQRQRAFAEGHGDQAGVDRATQALEGMAKGLERDPQMESMLDKRRPELGLQRDIGRDLARELAQTLDRGRDHGISR